MCLLNTDRNQDQRELPPRILATAKLYQQRGYFIMQNTRREFLKVVPAALFVANGSSSDAAEPSRNVNVIDDLTPNGRGGFVRVSQRSLEELLRQYDAAYPEYTDLSREDVIRFYGQTEERVRHSFYRQGVSDAHDWNRRLV